MLIVQKYGGTSLAGMSRLRAAARRVTGLARQGNQVVVVVSAQGDTTDMLIEKATQVNRRGSAREMDAYLAAGEQMSAGLMTMAIGAMGYSAVSLTGRRASGPTASTATPGYKISTSPASAGSWTRERSWSWQAFRASIPRGTSPRWGAAVRTPRR